MASPSRAFSLDFETTGIRSRDLPTEIGCVSLDNYEDYFCELINPKIPIPGFVAKLTGITDELVADKREEKEVILDFLAWLKQRTNGKHCYIVAYNASFDYRFMKGALQRHGIDEPDWTWICALKLARCRLELPKYTLATVYEALGLDSFDAHRALADAVACARIYDRLRKDLDHKDVAVSQNPALSVYLQDK